MHVQRLKTATQLHEIREQWMRLTGGVPFRGFPWMTSWWHHYQEGRELYVLAVYDSTHLVGLLPLCRTESATHGRVLEWLGAGEVCTDYLSLSATGEYRRDAVREAARWLMETGNRRGPDSWDALILECVPETDATVDSLMRLLQENGHDVLRRQGLNCWRLHLPKTWDEMYPLFSKSHRKQIRRLERRVLDTDRCQLRQVTSLDELEHGLEILIDLHQRRRLSLDEPGCFASPAFAGFVREAAELLLLEGSLRLLWLELDGEPVAAELQLAGDGVTYAYQAGVDPERMEAEPGRLITMATIRQAIDEEQRSLDFLRGDEPYKAHSRAEPVATTTYRAAARRPSARLRQGVWLAGDTMKTLLKSSLPAFPNSG